MKKLVSVLFALLLVGSFAFAEITTGAWTRFAFVPTANVDVDVDGYSSDPFAFGAPNWGGRGRVGVNFGASDENSGFSLHVYSNGNTLSVGDQAKVWVKFNDMIALQGGKVQGDVLRGKIDDSGYLGAFGDVYAQGTTGKDDLFKRFYPTTGVLLDVTPAEGVYIGAALDAYTEWGDAPLTENMFKNIQIGAGYVIPNIGHARVQYIGSDDIANKTGAEIEDEAKYIQAAFAYTAMEGLVVDAGLKYQTVSKAEKSTATVHASYTKDALAAIARLQVGFGEKGENDDLMLKASGDVAYTVADPLAVGAEVSYYSEGDFKNITIAPYGKLGYGNGFFKTGFLYSMATVDGSDYGLADVDVTAWAIPLMLQFGF
jgi:hypothetical protein